MNFKSRTVSELVGLDSVDLAAQVDMLQLPMAFVVSFDKQIRCPRPSWTP